MRTTPHELKQLEILDCRTRLSVKEEKQLQNCRRGYSGELEFDRITDMIGKHINHIHLKDYRFIAPDSDKEIQVDNIIITGDRLYTFEVKNYSFDLEYRNNGPWKYVNGNDFSNPITQIDNQKITMDKLLNDIGWSVGMSNNIVFINNEQTIYNLPNTSYIYVRNHLNKRLKHIIKNNLYDYTALVESIESRRLLRSVHDTDVEIDFNILAGGLFCNKCYQPLVKYSRLSFICNQCGSVIGIADAINILIAEMNVLNREWLIDSIKLAKLSGGTIGSSTIRRYRNHGLVQY